MRSQNDFVLTAKEYRNGFRVWEGGNAPAAQKQKSSPQGARKPYNCGEPAWEEQSKTAENYLWLKSEMRSTMRIRSSSVVFSFGRKLLPLLAVMKPK